MVRYIDAHRGEHGVEPICRVLQVAPSTYYAAKSRPPSARAIRDAVLLPILLAVWTANYKVYGARKLWQAARRAGHDIGRDQVARLMRELGIRGVRRGRRVFTTRRDDQAARAPGGNQRPDWAASDLCAYFGDWVAIKAHWGLSMDQSEYGRIRIRSSRRARAGQSLRTAPRRRASSHPTRRSITTPVVPESSAGSRGR